MPRYADVDRLMEHAIRMDWSSLKWVHEVDIYTSINPNVVERKRGKWIKYYRHQVNSYCSVCNKEVGRETNFCPNCGAEMERKRSEDA